VAVGGDGCVGGGAVGEVSWGGVVADCGVFDG